MRWGSEDERAAVSAVRPALTRRLGFDRMRVRCSSCGRVMPVILVWVKDDSCAGCGRPLSKGPHRLGQTKRTRDPGRAAGAPVGGWPARSTATTVGLIGRPFESPADSPGRYCEHDGARQRFARFKHMRQ